VWKEYFLSLHPHLKKNNNFMKIAIKISLFSTLLGIFACKNVDQNLVKDMQQATTTIESAKPAIEQASQGLANLQNKILPVADKAPSEAIQYMTKRMGDKYSVMMSQYNATKTELEQLSKEYSDGKIKTEEVSQRFSALKAQVADFEKGFAAFTAMTNRPLEDLEKLGENMLQSDQKAGVQVNPNATPTDADVEAGRAAPQTDANTTDGAKQKQKATGDGGTLLKKD
jgi:chromosome segregation ATPase